LDEETHGEANRHGGGARIQAEKKKPPKIARWISLKPEKWWKKKKEEKNNAKKIKGKWTKKPRKMVKKWQKENKTEKGEKKKETDENFAVPSFFFVRFFSTDKNRSGFFFATPFFFRAGLFSLQSNFFIAFIY
jgi:CRISPR/Cas system CSM-associated protein Csm4 (group 5 of RAMP superfamily)